MKTHLVWLILFFGFKSWAFTCPDAIHKSALAAADYLVKVAIIGEKDNRFDYPTYARDHDLTPAQMKQKFSGTGEFHCGGIRGGANLVSNNGRLALSSHQFFKEDKQGKCLGILDKKALSDCYFYPISSDGTRIKKPFFIDPDSLKMQDYPCGIARPGHCADRDTYGNDWAVVDLLTPVPDSMAGHYEVTDTTILNGKVSYDHPLNISVVAAFADNFAGGNIPTICDGMIGYLKPQTDSATNEIAQTNSCSAGRGTSGGGVIFQPQKGQTPLLVGISTRSKNKELDGVQYGNDNFTAGPTVQGDFLKAIRGKKINCPSK